MILLLFSVISLDGAFTNNPNYTISNGNLYVCICADQIDVSWYWLIFKAQTLGFYWSENIVQFSKVMKGNKLLTLVSRPSCCPLSQLNLTVFPSTMGASHTPTAVSEAQCSTTVTQLAAVISVFCSPAKSSYPTLSTLSMLQPVSESVQLASFRWEFRQVYPPNPHHPHPRLPSNYSTTNLKNNNWSLNLKNFLPETHVGFWIIALNNNPF